MAATAPVAAVTIANPSFEGAWKSSLPSCWMVDGGAKSSTSGVAHSGKYSAKLSISKVSSSPRLVIDRKTAGCAPVVAAGRQYTVSIYYRSSVPVRIMGHVNTAAGGWTWIGQSAEFPATSTWRLATYTTPALPAAAQGRPASFGMALSKAGWFTIDDVSVVALPAGAANPTGSPSQTPSASPTSAPSTTPPITIPSTPPVTSAPTKQGADETVTGGGTVTVRTAAELKAALAAALPGQTIALADGTYAGNFTLKRSGTAQQPIRIVGSRAAIIDGGKVSGGVSLHLDSVSYVAVQGITIRNAQKPLLLDQSSRVTLTGLDVGVAGTEAVTFRNNSTDNVLSASLVHDAGLSEKDYGEGVYIGIAYSKWSSSYSRTAGKPDASDRNQIVGNHIWGTTAEPIDIKEGTTGGLISGNLLDGTALTGANYADSWIDVKGNGYRILANTGVNSGTVLLDGYQQHVATTGWGRANIFDGNVSAVNGKGYGISVQDASAGTVVYNTNTVTGAAKGLSNQPITVK